MDQPDLQKYQIGIICALPREMRAVQAVLDEIHEPLKIKDARDNNAYVLGRIHHHNVVIACLGIYGSISAAVVSQHMLWTFPALRFGLLVGVGGGVPDLRKAKDIRLGDVVVSLPEGVHGGVVQFDFGKTLTGGKFQRVGSLNKPPAALLTALSLLRSQLHNISSEIAAHLTISYTMHPQLKEEGYGCPGSSMDHLMCPKCDPSQWWWLIWLVLVWICPLLRCDMCENGVIPRKVRRSQNPEVHYGTIISGSKVVKDAVLRDQLSQEFDAKCIEMEAAGLMDNYPCLVIRGICDYADQHKNKVWQDYASLTAAAYVKEFLRHISATDTQQENPILQLTENVKQQMQTVTKHFEADQKRHDAQEIRYQEQRYLDCHRAFKTTQYSEARDAIPERIPGTCRWVTDHLQFTQWLASNTNDLLWVSADPGCGKSVLARSLTDNELKATSSHYVCYFFFKDIEERNTLSAALCALLHQLFDQEPQLLEVAMSAWVKHKERLVDEIDVLWSILLSVGESPRTGNITFILDALDECREDHRKKLIQYLVNFYKKSSQFSVNTTNASCWVKFIVTSRPYDDIRLEFQLPYHLPSIRLRGEDETDQIKQEINLVIFERVKKLSMDLQLKPQTEERLRGHLQQMEHRTYLWLYLAIESIYEDFRDSLCPEEEIIETLPTTVEEAYEGILKRVRQKQRPSVKRILQIVIGAKRSLTVEEMAKALGIAIAFGSNLPTRTVDGQHLQQQIKEWCGLFIIINQTKIYLIHQTAKEFLLQRPTDVSVQDPAWKHTLSPLDIEQLMTWICIKYLLISCYDVDMSSRSRAEISDSFFEYSARRWPEHAITSNSLTPEDQIGIMLQLLDKTREGHHSWMFSFMASNRAWGRYAGNDTITPMSFAAGNGLLKLLEKLIPTEDCTYTQPLEYASRMGRLKAIQLLVKHGANIRECQGKSLSLAAERGHLEVVRYLVDNGADVNLGAQAPISQAAIKGHKEIVELLAQNGADVNANKGQALIHMVSRGYIDTVQLLLEHDANVHASRTSVVAQAIRDGQLDIVKRIYECGADIDQDLGKALVDAVRSGHEEIVKFVVDLGAAIDVYKDTALCIAAKHGRGEMVDILLKYGANPNQESFFMGELPAPSTVLACALTSGHLNIAHRLLEHGVEVNAGHGAALVGAVLSKKQDVVKFILDQGADVYAGAGHALLVAARLGNHSIVELFFRYCTDTWNFPNSILSDSVKYGNIKTVEIYLKNGADINNIAVEAMNLMFRDNNEEMAAFLLKHGANTTEAFRLAFYTAVVEHNKYMVEWVLQQRLDVNIPTMNFPGANILGVKDFLHLALREGDEEIVELFLKYEKNLNCLDDKALRLSCWKGDLKIGKLLVKYGVRMRFSARELLRKAISKNDEEMVELLLKDSDNIPLASKTLLGFKETDLSESMSAILDKYGVSITRGRALIEKEILLRYGGKVA